MSHARARRQPGRARAQRIPPRAGTVPVSPVLQEPAVRERAWERARGGARAPRTGPVLLPLPVLPGTETDARALPITPTLFMSSSGVDYCFSHVTGAQGSRGHGAWIITDCILIKLFKFIWRLSVNDAVKDLKLF